MSASFHVYWSPRVEELAQRLSELLDQKLSSPFAREAIVVGSPGLDRWVTEVLARRFEVWANPWIVTPRRFVEELLVTVGVEPTISPAAVRWALVDELSRSTAEPVTKYLADDTTGARRLELAAHLTVLFERYAQHAPALLTDDHWQGQLARAIDTRFPGRMTAARVRALTDAIGTVPDLPERVCVFGAPHMPPLVLDVLASLSQRVPVHIFVPSAGRGRRHSLVEALGEHVRAGYQALSDRGIATTTGPEALAKRETMLQILQRELAEDVPRGPAVVTKQRHPITVDDRTIEVFSCHGAMREAETVRDRLLELFAKDETLRPRDVCVLTPALEQYAPYLAAAFSADEARHLSVRIADGGKPRTSAGGAVLVTALQALRGRFDVTSVMDMVVHPAVSARWGFDDSARPTIEGWLHELGVHWGADEEHRCDEGFVSDGSGEVLGVENTFRTALDRLLLGVAVPSHGERMVANVLPFDDVEGDTAELAGRFAEFVEGLLGMRPAFVGKRPLAEWKTVLEALVDHLLPKRGKLAFEERLVRRRLDELWEGATLAGFAESLSFETLVPWIEDLAEEDARGMGFASGMLTVGALLPMRNVPFRVIALVGLGDAFPRRVGADSLDRLKAHPSVRDEDRGAFLDALGSARDCFFITYPGRDSQENARLAPSVVVSELLDAVDSTFTVGDGPAHAHVHLDVPLAPWDVRLFTEARARSASKVFAAAARASLDEPRAEAPFFRTRLPDEEVEPIDLDRLATTLADPIRRLLSDRLQIVPPDCKAELENADPVALDNLQDWSLRERVFRLLDTGVDRETIARIVRASASLSPGAVGDRQLADALALASDLRSKLHVARGDVAREPIPVDLQVPTNGAHERIVGALDGVFAKGRVVVRTGKLRLEHKIELWVRHLALCAVAPAGVLPRSTYFGCADGKVVSFTLGAVENPPLAKLVELYRLARTAALPLFGDASVKVALELSDDPTEDDERALSEVLRGALEGKWFLSDRFVGRVLRGAEPWAPGFRVPAESGLTPIDVVRQLVLPILAAAEAE